MNNKYFHDIPTKEDAEKLKKILKAHNILVTEIQKTKENIPSLNIHQLFCYFKDTEEKSISGYFKHEIKYYRKILNKFIEYFPKEPEFYKERIKILLEKIVKIEKCKKHDKLILIYGICLKCIDDCGKVIELSDNKTKAEYLCKKVGFEIVLKLFDKAEQDYYKLIKFPESKKLGYFRLNCLAQEAGLYEEAEKSYKLFLKNNKNREKYNNDYYDEFYNFADCLIKSGKYREAVKYLNKYIKQAVYEWIDINYKHTGNTEEYNKSLNLFNKCRTVEELESHFHITRRSACRISDDIYLIEFLNNVYDKKAYAEIKLKQYDNAIRDCHKSVKTEGWAELFNLYRLLECYLATGRTKRAEITENLIKKKKDERILFTGRFKRKKTGLFWISKDFSQVITEKSSILSVSEAYENSDKKIIKNGSEISDIIYVNKSHGSVWDNIDKDKIIRAGGNPDKNGWKSLYRGYVAYDVIKNEFIFAGGKWLTDKLVLTKIAEIFGIGYDDILRYGNFLNTEYRIEYIKEFDLLEEE